MARVSERKFPLNAKDYELYEEVGDGVSATVYRALCIPLKEIVAIKVLDLEKCNNDLDGIRREVQTMSLIDHPNLLRGHCSFTADHCLWLVMPFMAGGSCLHIMKSSFPEGFEEPVIATLLRETLRALVYLHAQGHIHRDVKAGNILIDSNGTIKLADFGVSACMFDSGDRQRSRNTFVGTPCWMAPEVMQQLHGYNFKADIWSFGITALELAHGHAPFSKYPPMKVLLMTLQNAPPGLDYERDKRFSKSFKDLVATCLVKDPKKRPTSEKLLKHSFFKQARSPDYLARTILEGLPPLGERYRTLKAKEADLLMQNKAEYENKDQLSQQEYVRGISAWNFNLEDLKSQAALIPDYECVSHVEDPDSKQNDRLDDIGFSPERASSSATAPSQEDGLNDIHDLESSLASFPIKLQALRGCFDVGEDDDDATTPNWEHIGQLDSGQPLLTKNSIGSLSQNAERNEDENTAQSNSLSHQVVPAQKKFFSGSLIPDGTFSSKKIITDTDRDFQQPKDPAERNYSGQLYRTRRDTVEDPSEGQLVQRRGRFKVTSTDVSPKGPGISAFNPFSGGLSSPTSLNLSAVSILSSLQMYLQQNAMQREDAVKLMKIVEQTCAKQSEASEGSIDELLQMTPASTREKELQSQVNQLHQDVSMLSEELKKQKERNLQLEKQLNAAASSKEERKE